MAKKKKRTQADYEELARRAASGDFPTRPLTPDEEKKVELIKAKKHKLYCVDMGTLHAAIEIARSHKCGHDCFDPDGNATGYCKHAIADEIERQLG
jgi:diaminopimelate epimerase